MIVGTKLSKQDKGSTVDSSLYKTQVGSLMYLTATIPNIMYAASFISRFMESPNDSHWKVEKTILRYVTGIINYSLWCKNFEDHSLIGYTDNDLAGNIDDMKNTSRYAFHLGTNVISWASKKYPIVSISSSKA